MRVIEKKIIEAMQTKESIKLSCRDEVISFSNGKRNYYLWNSHIFTVTKENAVMFSFAGYNTNTTKSRINALLSHYTTAKIMQKNYELFFCFEGEKTPIDTRKHYCFYSGKLSEIKSI